MADRDFSDTNAQADQFEELQRQQSLSWPKAQMLRS